MNEIVRLVERHGLSVYVHAIGDGATRQVLDAVALARKSGPCAHCRHTITHLQWVWPSDFPRFKALGVLANVQEGWLAPRSIGGAPGYDYAKAIAASPLGSEMGQRIYPFRQLHAAGARLAGGSDWFFTEENPWIDVEAGLTSRDPGAADSVPMVAAHTLDLATLLRARTIDAAYQLYEERSTGSIEVDKRADLVVLDQDVTAVATDRIHETKVLMTVFDGRPVFERPGTFQ